MGSTSSRFADPYRRPRVRTRTAAIALAAALGGAVTGLAAGIQPGLAVIPLVLAIPFVIWRVPHSIVVMSLLASTVVEEWTYTVGAHKGAFTDNIPLWRSVFHGMILFPIEILLLTAIVIWLLRASLDRALGLPKSPVTTCFKALWVLLVVALAVGLMHGAQTKDALWELRSWIFLTVAYLLAASSIRSRKAFDALLWTLVIGSGFKGIQGTAIYFSYARAMSPRPEEILGHEEALFFGIYLLLTAGLWLYGIKGRLRTTATILMPFVLIADLANSRRVAWAVFPAALLTLFLIALKTLPERRRFVRRALFATAIASAVYLPLYWNHDNGTLGQPARAVKSVISPNSRDLSSDNYRVQEDVNLLLNIQSSGPLGRGFGVPIDYSVSIANISNIDAMIAFVPHNGVLWVWMRLGLQGEIVFWSLIGCALARGAQLARCPDRRLALLGAVLTGSIVGYTIMGYNDMGFAFFRVSVLMGCLLGTLEAALRFAAGLAAEDSVGASVGSTSAPARPPVPARAIGRVAGGD